MDQIEGCGSPPTNICFVFVEYVSSPPWQRICYMSFDFDGDDFRVQLTPVPPPAVGGVNRNFVVHDSYDGLLLLTQADTSEQLILYNPVTRWCEFLPAHKCINFSRSYDWKIVRGDSSGRYNVIGLDTNGFDPERTRLRQPIPKCLMLEVDGCDGNYSRSSWKELAPPRCPIGTVEGRGMRSDGKVSWLINRNSLSRSVRTVLLSFDIATRRFRLRPCTPMAADQERVLNHFFEYDSTFYRMTHFSGNERAAKLWVLMDVDSRRGPIWVEQQVNISDEPQEYYDIPVAVHRGMSKLIVINTNCSICEYDLISGDWREPDVVGDESGEYGMWGNRYIPHTIM